MPVTQTYTEEQIKLNYFLCPCLCFWTDPVWSYLTSSTTFLCWCSVGKGWRSKPPLKASPLKEESGFIWWHFFSADYFIALFLSWLGGMGRSNECLALTYKIHVTGNRCDAEHLGSAWGSPLAWGEEASPFQTQIQTWEKLLEFVFLNIKFRAVFFHFSFLKWKQTLPRSSYLTNLQFLLPQPLYLFPDTVKGILDTSLPWVVSWLMYWCM